MLRKLLATTAAALGAVGLGAGTAGALAFAPFSDPASAEAQSVVRILTPYDNGMAECTGTAVAPQWVLTAQHCVDGATLGGTVTTGQGADTRQFQINAWETAPAGDIALIHVTEDMGLSHYPEIAANVAPAGSQAQAYGWSSLGQGVTGKLPTAPVDIMEYGSEDSYGAQDVYMTRTQLPTVLQQGDSGSPIFQDGRVVGVLSMGISYVPVVPPTVTGLYIHVQTAPLHGWMQGVLATNPTAPAPEAPAAPEVPEFPLPLPSSSDIEGIFGSVDIDELLPEGVQLPSSSSLG
ncbi:trypsin-like serine protease [Corynebacterium sp. 335C]